MDTASKDLNDSFLHWKNAPRNSCPITMR
jgi:hypothetical protein